MSDTRCKCSMAITMAGDGCRYCQPQEYIDSLEVELIDGDSELSSAQADNEALRAALVAAQGASACDDGYGRVCAIVSTALGITGSAWLLHQKAEAVEAMAENIRADVQGTNTTVAMLTAIDVEAQRLRAEADEIERGGDHG